MLENLLKAFRHNELYWILKEFISQFKVNCDQVEIHENDIKSLYLQIETLKEMIEKLEQKQVSTKKVPTTKKATKKD